MGSMGSMGKVAASPPFLSNAIKVSNPHFKWGVIWNPSGVLY